MPLPPDLRWLDPLLDVLVDEYIDRHLSAPEPTPKIEPTTANLERAA